MLANSAGGGRSVGLKASVGRKDSAADAQSVAGRVTVGIGCTSASGFGCCCDGCGGANGKSASGGGRSGGVSITVGAAAAGGGDGDDVAGGKTGEGDGGCSDAPSASVTAVGTEPGNARTGGTRSWPKRRSL